MTEANLLTEWAGLLFASLADAGVRDVVLSPGSRSTPFVAAAVRETRLSRHVVIDERAAAFFALGQARVTGRPSVVLCTSGTAAAHYLPAMIEADIVGTPLLILTADRPHELYDCRAPQTIDQVKIFGEHARQFFDLVPDASEGSLRALRRVALQSALATLWPRAGAVHLNARARKPLEPLLATNPGEAALSERARAVARVPPTFVAPPRALAADSAISAAVEVIAAGRRGIVVVGPAALAQRGASDAIWKLSAATGFPVACEATSQLRFGPRPPDAFLVDGFELLLRSPTFRARAAFDVAIQIGAPPTSGPWEQLALTTPRVVLAEAGWPDPQSAARVVVHGEIASSCSALAAAFTEPHADPELTGFVRAANERAWAAAEPEIARTAVEAGAVRALIAAAPAGSLLAIGNSLAVRLVDIYARASERELGVLSQRGASGIDGLVAGAAGAASASGRPLALLLGDVSLLHDLSSLALAAKVKTPLVIFVLHNGGGRIFEMLPLADAKDVDGAVLDHATTPHATDFAHAAALYGTRYARVSAAAEISAVLVSAYAHPGCTLVEVTCPPHGATDLSRRAAAAVEAAIAADT